MVVGVGVGVGLGVGMGMVCTIWLCGGLIVATTASVNDDCDCSGQELGSLSTSASSCGGSLTKKTTGQLLHVARWRPPAAAAADPRSVAMGAAAVAVAAV